MFNSVLEILAAVAIAFLAGALYGKSQSGSSPTSARFEVVPS